MVAAAKRGVKVRFIAAVLSEEGKVNGNARGVTTLLNGGVNAVCKTFLYIHAKMILADYGTSNAQAYIGSENFSCVSLNENRECGIIVTDSAILSRLNTTYASDWAQPSVTVTPDNTPLTPMQRGNDCADENPEKERGHSGTKAHKYQRGNQSQQSPAPLTLPPEHRDAAFLYAGAGHLTSRGSRRRCPHT
jgi:phosphatidylserine/phosphatidylglycerophosphate/cardiolipin synthase-like enzyme